MPDTAQISPCNNVTKLDIVQAIDVNPTVAPFDELKKCTKARTGRGRAPGDRHLQCRTSRSRSGLSVKAICEHFDYSRQ